VLYIGHRFIEGQRFQVRCSNDSLSQLLHARRTEQIAQLVLSHQKHLQQHAVPALEVSQQAQLFYRALGQPLCFIDNEHAASPPSSQIGKKLLKRHQQGGLAGLCQLQSE